MKFKVFVSVVTLSLLVSSCCDLTFMEGKPNGFYEAISRDNSFAFRDSVGNVLILHMNFEEVQERESLGHVGGCSTADDKFEYRVAGWKQFAGPSFTVDYNGISPYSFPHCVSSNVKFGNANAVTNVELSCYIQGDYQLENLDIVVQGESYTNCWVWTKSDTLGNELGKLVVDRDEGFLIFSMKDRFRWERIPD